MVFLRILSIAFCLSLTCRSSFCSPAPEARKETIEAILEALEKRLEETSDSSTLDFAEVGEAVETEMLEKREAIMADKTLLTPDQIAGILKQHNDERSATKGNDMMEMTWDDELAKLAQGLSDGCIFHHANMELPDGTRTGQNIAMGSSQNYPLERLVQMWIDEKNGYNLRTGACTGVCGHYTQIVWHNSDKVGCGLTKCPGYGVILVCDYLRAGNMRGKKPVNLGGAPCSKCNLSPGTACKNGLCSVCQPGSRGCKPYDASTCVDKDPGTCGWAHKYCKQSKYRAWLEKKCMKTCGFCVS